MVAATTACSWPVDMGAGDMASTLEEALRTLEAQVDAALGGAQSLQKTLRKAKAAASVGNLKDVDRSLGSVVVTGTELTKRLESLRNAWLFRAEEYFSDGRFADELIEAAKEAGLRLIEKDGRLYCHPMLLSVASKDLAVLVDRKPERRVRPSRLIQSLLARQKQPRKFAIDRILELLFSGYRVLAPSYDRTWSPESPGRGPVVPLVSLHDVLTLLPSAAKDYSLAEFGRDVNLLDRNPDTRTKDGRKFTLPAATGTKGGKRLTVIEETGAERIYVGIAFQKE